jgi:tetratricopeptide (TPR) repeat protein
LREGLEVDSSSLVLRRTLINVQLSAGLYHEADMICRSGGDKEPTFAIPCASAQLLSGERDKALEALKKRPRATRAGAPRDAGWIEAIEGRRTEAEEIAATFEGWLPQRQAEIFALLGDKDRALQALERLAKINPNRAAYELSNPLIGLRGDPWADEFRRKLRFEQ